MKLLFCGTPPFARVILERLYQAYRKDAEISVISAPDRRAGRGMHLVSSPVSEFAKEHLLPLYTPQTLKDRAFEETLKKLDPDLCIVAAYGKILPEYFLNAPRLGCINAHASLLPEYRGAAPIERALLDGKDKTGITCMQMDPGLDTGDILMQRSVPIADTDTGLTLTEKLAELAADMIVEIISDAFENRLRPKKQDDTRSTYAEKLTREEEKIDWTQTAAQIDRRIRAFAPRPNACCTLPNGEELKICRALPHPAGSAHTPGKVRVQAQKIYVSASDGELELLRVKPQGKGEMDASALINGRKLKDGDLLL